MKVKLFDISYVYKKYCELQITIYYLFSAIPIMFQQGPGVADDDVIWWVNLFVTYTYNYMYSNIWIYIIQFYLNIYKY